MKKFISPILALTLIAALGVVPASAEEELVYGTATLTYAEFYAGDVSSTDSIDAVTSATTGKSGTFANTVSDFVDAETNPDGYHITGVANVNVAVAAADVDAYKAINDTFVEVEEAPAQYKPVAIEDGKAVYSATVFNVADTVADAEIEVVTDSHWGDYQINIIETSTQHIRNTREDEGFDIGSGILGIIVETESGLKVGMEHLQSIWVQPWEISWNVSVDNTHNEELTYDNLPELDKLMGETVTCVTFINANDSYVYEFEGAYLPVKFEGSLSVENAEAAVGSTLIAVEGLPEDYAAEYSVEGLGSAVTDSELTWEEALPGAYTLVLSDAEGVYAPMSADFVLTTDAVPAIYDADANALVPAEDGDQALRDAFLANLSTVSVNGTDYSVAGRGAVVIVNTEGEIDLEAAVVKGRGEDATSEPVFAEAGSYDLVASAVGFDQTVSFTVEIAK